MHKHGNMDAPPCSDEQVGTRPRKHTDVHAKTNTDMHTFRPTNSQQVLCWWRKKSQFPLQLPLRMWQRIGRFPVDMQRQCQHEWPITSEPRSQKTQQLHFHSTLILKVVTGTANTSRGFSATSPSSENRWGNRVTEFVARCLLNTSMCFILLNWDSFNQYFLIFS